MCDRNYITSDNTIPLIIYVVFSINEKALFNPF